MNPKSTLALSLLFLHGIYASGQTAGEIFSPATSVSSFLDPDLDNFITATGAAFSGSADEITEFEGNWTARYQRVTEPSGDAATGSACASVDIVDPPGEKYALYTSVYDPDGYPTNSDGDEFFLVRLRIGKDPGNANFGYSVLLDTDLLFGSGTDPNSVTGNEGFEIEIRLKNGGGGKGIHLDDVDGTTSGTNKASYAIGTHHQKSYAAYTATGCTNDPIFVDIAIPFSDLQTYFGLTPSSNVRIVAATTSSGASALGSGVSDISGTDDDDPSYITQDDIFADVTTNQPANQSLPVELRYLSVDYLQSQPQLVWETSSEVNTDYFAVEISNDGSHFTTLGKVAALGTSITGKTYRFPNMPLHNDLGTYYARLRIVDFDGYTEYSSTVSIVLNTASRSLQVFPNPATAGYLHISTTASDLSAEVQLINPLGRVVSSHIIQGQQTIDISTMAPGLYVLRSRSGSTSTSLPVQIR